MSVGCDDENFSSPKESCGASVCRGEAFTSIIQAQRAYFRSGATLDVNFRREMLKKLQAALAKWE